jgi:mono/diheme cytochrome c family protein
LLTCALWAPVLAAGGAGEPQRQTAAPMRGYQVLSQSCFKCHGGGTKLSGLDLHSRSGALKGGQHGAAVTPGSAEKSLLFAMVRGHRKPQMPPTGGLPDADVAALRAWIDAGAPYPTVAAKADDRWWAFRPVSSAPAPRVRDAWVRNPVDAFVLGRLRENGLKPSREADRVTLIRRVTLDLHGLPPTPEEIDRFVTDRSPNSYEKLVDRLLASPRYGERQARHWLDLARFAESEGFKADETRPNAWRYRDYVIESFNSDKPYQRFVAEQIAGDEIAPTDPRALVATGFNRHWADESNARNLRLRRQEILNDITDTVGSVMLGMTVGCARCHDHKYDPITQKDYYRLQAFFAASQPVDDLALAPEAERSRHRVALAQWEEKTRATRARLAELETPYRAKLAKGKRMPFPDDVLAAFDTPPAQRTAIQWQLAMKLAPQLEVKDEEVGKAMKGADKARWHELNTEISRHAPDKPADLPLGIGIRDVGREAPVVHTLSVGLYDQPKEEVQPGFLSAVTTELPRIEPLAAVNSTGRRTALAGWLSRADNPLTSRVIVNRIWQQHFGRGIVASASDFGRTGELPTHPELLDWLASRFMAPTGPSGTGAARDAEGMGGSLKRLHRLLLTSATYRQASANDTASAAKDPENKLLWRYRRWRLEGEAIRDACLLASGQLDNRMGGPSVFPELPRGVVTRGGWTVSKDEADRNRRSVYVFVRRNMRYPLFEVFDFPDTHEPCARRGVTNTAPQALMLFNNELSLKLAQGLAGRVSREADTADGRIERAYRHAFGRVPESEERDQARKFLSRQVEILRSRQQSGEKLAQPTGAPGMDEVEGAALVDFCHALFNANEFLFVD